MSAAVLAGIVFGLGFGYALGYGTAWRYALKLESFGVALREWHRHFDLAKYANQQEVSPREKVVGGRFPLNG